MTDRHMAHETTAEEETPDGSLPVSLQPQLRAMRCRRVAATGDSYGVAHRFPTGPTAARRRRRAPMKGLPQARRRPAAARLDRGSGTAVRQRRAPPDQTARPDPAALGGTRENTSGGPRGRPVAA